MNKPSYIEYTAEPLAGGRAIMRCEIVINGEVEQSYLVGSPAAFSVVAAHESRHYLGHDDADAARATR